MAWEKPLYNKSEINWAGRVLRDSDTSSPDMDKALEILDNWRAVHSYPMHVFYMRLKIVSKKLDKDSLIASRLKRAPAIIAKLRRKYHGHNPSMALYQMQDIGGCRAVLSNVTLAKKLCDNYYLKGDLKHKRTGFKDYITTPKQDGYRGIHLIYNYNSDREGKKEYTGLLIEVQIRSRLQHIWATAVETAGFFTRQAIKSNEGSPELLEFFKLVSAAFAKIENCPVVPDTPGDEKELYAKIKQKEKELNIINKMRGWTSALKVFNEKTKRKGEVRFSLLELDIPGEKLLIHTYTKKEEQQALNEYATLEKRYTGNKEYDVVLVSVDAAHDLQKAYPNYFVDTYEFLNQLHRIIDKAK